MPNFDAFLAPIHSLLVSFFRFLLEGSSSETVVLMIAPKNFGRTAQLCAMEQGGNWQNWRAVPSACKEGDSRHHLQIYTQKKPSNDKGESAKVAKDYGHAGDRSQDLSLAKRTSYHCSTRPSVTVLLLFDVYNLLYVFSGRQVKAHQLRNLVKHPTRVICMGRQV